MLRVAAAARTAHGRDAVGPLYATLGKRIFEREQVAEDPASAARRGSRAFVEPVLAEAGLPTSLADALDDSSCDVEIQAETGEALALTGKDVGTPILHVEPPHGVAFFGPVISRLPDDDQAVELWDHVIALAVSRASRS